MMESRFGSPDARHPKWIGFALWFCTFLVLYYVMYGRFLLSDDVLQKGGVLEGWSVAYLVLQSLQSHAALPWWDFGGLGGWPAHVAFLHGWFDALSPLDLTFLGAFFAATRFGSISPGGVAQAAILYQSIYPFALCLLGLMLATREIIANYIARLFPPLVFALTAFQFQELQTGRGATTLAAAIFFLYSLLRFDRRRDPKSVLLLLALLALLLASGSPRELLVSGTWVMWLSIVLLASGMLRDLTEEVAKLWSVKLYRFALTACVAMIGLACATWAITGDSNMARVVDPGLLSPDAAGWKALAQSGFRPLYHALYILPFTEAYWKLGLTPSLGILPSFQYIGLATLPLCLVALCLGSERRTIRTLLLALLASLATTLVLATVARRFVIPALPTHYETVLGIPQLPRGGPALLLLLLAATGLDLLTAGSHHFASGLVNAWTKRAAALRFICLLGGLALMGAVALVCLVLVVSPSLTTIRHSLMHVGLYLGLFCILAMLLLLDSAEDRRVLTITFLIFTLADVTTSASSYFLVDPRYFEYRSDRSAAPAVLDAIDNPALPTTAVGKHYHGQFHNIMGPPTVGLSDWLVLARRPRESSLLANWDGQTGRVVGAPKFSVHATGHFAALSDLSDPDRIVPPPSPDAWIYLHEKESVKDDAAAGPLAGARVDVKELTPNRVGTVVTMPRPGFVIFHDNYHPNWHAYVDGKEVAIHRANFVAKAVALSAGTSRVVWVYDPFAVKMVWGVFYLAVLAFVVTIVVAARHALLPRQASAFDLYEPHPR